MTDRVILRGWGSICAVMDYSKNSYQSAKVILEELKILHYENNRPVVLLSDLEKYYFIRFQKHG